VWCAVARSAVAHPRWGPGLTRLLRTIAPFVLIALGLWIIAHHPAFHGLL